MTLTNPTDDQLNRNFAIYVAECGPEHPAYDGHDYCGSFDAVLPWLEKLGWRGTSNRAGSTCAATVVVNSLECDGREFIAQCDYTTTQTPLPRAAVIALLRAHGVEIVFT